MSQEDAALNATAEDSDRVRSVVLTEHDPLVVLEMVPRTVFPVSMQVELGRTRGADNEYTEHDQQQLPVEPRLPDPEPYIPTTTIYFDNPAERAPDGQTMWRPDDCIKSLRKLLEHFEAETDVDPDRLLVQRVTFAEVSAQYLTTDGGDLVVSPKLYEEQGEFSVVTFDRDTSLTATRIRDQLDNALPGNTRTPLQLTEIVEATAKPSRLGKGTTQQASRKQYYTENDAERHNDLSVTPKIWQPRRTTTESMDARPIGPALDDLDKFIPNLAGSELVEKLTFTGESRTQERFYADGILTR